jgi:hypothetical protein
VASIVVAASLSAHGARAAGAAPATLIYFDPDANYQAMPEIISTLERALQRTAPELRVIGAHDQTRLASEASGKGASFAFMATRFNLPASPCTPTLVPEAQGKRSYRKVLLDLGRGKADNLMGKRIATTGIGSGGQGVDAVLASLAQAGIGVKGAVLLPLSKDIDALFAVALGQADAALVTRDAIAFLREVDPTSAKNLRELWTSPEIEFPALCELRNVEQALRTKVIDAFLHFHETREGQAVLAIMGFERFVPYGPATTTAKVPG